MASETGFQITPLGRGSVLLEPQHGINPAESASAIEAILRQLAVHEAGWLYYALNDVAIIDPVYYTFLNQLASACHALGIEMIGLGIQPHTAYSLAAHMEEPPRFATALSLE